MVKVGLPVGLEETIHRLSERAGSLLEGEVHVQALPFFQLLGQKVLGQYIP